MGSVSDGHEVSGASLSRQDQHAHLILSEIAAGRPISQRLLASRLGIALGMTNLLLRRLVRRGLIRVSRVRANRLSYVLTPSGLAEKARMSRAVFHDSIRLYASARDRLRTTFESLSRDWPVHVAGDDSQSLKGIMFVGTGEAAEIGYLCLQETDLRLTGVVDFQGRTRFYGVPVFSAGVMSAELLEHLARVRPMMIAFSDAPQVQRFFAAAGIPAERIVWI